jgi:hypothetical protein
MKTPIYILFLLIVPAILIAQENPLDKLIEKYDGVDGTFFLDMKTNMVSDSVKSTNKILDLKMFVADVRNNNLSINGLKDEFYAIVDKEEYVGLIQVKSQEENVEVMVRKAGDEVSEFVIMILEKSELTMIAATGNFDLKQLARMEAFRNCKGLDVIQTICEEE